MNGAALGKMGTCHLPALTMVYTSSFVHFQRAMHPYFKSYMNKHQTTHKTFKTCQ